MFAVVMDKLIFITDIILRNGLSAYTLIDIALPLFLLFNAYLEYNNLKIEKSESYFD